MILSTERWSARTYAKGQSGHRVFDVSGATNEEQAISATGVGIGSTFDLDNRLIVRQGALSVSRNGRMWVVSADYTRRENGATGGGTTDNPIDEPPRLFIDLLDRDEAFDRTWDGKPVVNSVRDPFDQPLFRPRHTIILRYQRNESVYELAKHLAYENRLNTDTMTIKGIGQVLPGQLMFRSYKTARGFTADDDYVPCIYTFEARPYLQTSFGAIHGFHKRVLDQGYRGSKTATEIARIIDSAGRTVSQPVRLVLGLPFDTSAFTVDGVPGVSRPAPAQVDLQADAAYLCYDESEGEIAFSGLNLQQETV